MSTDPLTLLGIVRPEGPGTATLLSPTSRYHNMPVKTREMPDGRTVAYLPRRFPKDPETMRVITEHVVRDSDRLDRVAATHLGDPLLFWMICDANLVLDPDEVLAEPGARVIIAIEDPGA
jgi:hypothetical protein